jgi:hypothetical protein
MRKAEPLCDLGDADLSANLKFHRYFELSSRWKTREKTRFVSISPSPAGQCKNIGDSKGEVGEALRVTFLLSGMSAYVYGRAQLDEVMP